MRHFGGDNGVELSAEKVAELIEMLNKYNKLVQLFITARDKLIDNEVPPFRIRLFNAPHQRQYDLPTSDSIGAIVFDSGTKSVGDYDVIIEQKGYNTSMTLRDPSGNSSRKRKRLTMNMYYSYQLHNRFGFYDLMFRTGRLFQQYVVTAYCSIELDRIDYIRNKQQDIRSDYLAGIYDGINRGDQSGIDIGSRLILPASFTGGPRYMYSHYLDALAICRTNGNPQFFITFTCNFKWAEIRTFMSNFPQLTPTDRPDIVVRIYQQKRKQLLAFLKEDRPFGDVKAVLYTIEFQKRGLPHCHLLLWINSTTSITALDVYTYISAELPDSRIDPWGYQVVSDLMVHGPCGLAKLDAPCMKVSKSSVSELKCSKKFRKSFNDETFFDKDGYVHYRRRNTGIYINKSGSNLDNSYVVPYNRQLCLIFNAHINVEFWGWTMLIKYLFNYISKGTDRVVAQIGKDCANSPSPSTSSTLVVDEIKNFIDARFICPFEACWRIFNYPIHNREPAVLTLAVHLENFQSITFRSKESLQSIAKNPARKRTTLTEWLTYNKQSSDGHSLTYIDFPSKFVWNSSGKMWTPRRRSNDKVIGRLAYVHPTAGELFYLRMLLCHQRGCSSFMHIKTVNGITCPTYRVACEMLGLLGDDREWDIALEEATITATSSQMRVLFSNILLHCHPTNPGKLFDKHWKSMSYDIPLKAASTLHIDHLCINESDLRFYVLYELQILLIPFSKSVTDFGLPSIPEQLLADLQNRLIMEEKNYDYELLKTKLNELLPKMNVKQREIYKLVVDASDNNQQQILFIYGHGGTGKTFLWKSIITSLRSQGKIVLAVASSSIASLLLPSGQTAHSRFKIPIDLTDESMCNIKKKTHLGNLLSQTSLIVWDEAPMNDRRCFKTLDRTLRDLMNDCNTPFGGKLIIFGGDFRQTLPVTRRGSKQEIISSSIVYSYLWSYFKVHVLSENMRLQKPGVNSIEKKNIKIFSSWLLNVGNGNLGIPDEEDPSNASWINIPSKYCIEHDENGMLNLISFIYNDDLLQNPSASLLQQQVIVCPKNNDADSINESILSMVRRQETTYLSFDMAIPRINDKGETELLYPIEYLNNLHYPSLPPHRLQLKAGVPVILVRNINLAGGLCNGTRMIVVQMLTKKKTIPNQAFLCNDD
ncbi:uncharacterized protein [Rutidosis leptorrhynchoides]|uniref:uncharacterized protein n=1 Tax=Rutidosis leptorrhynchoides TaxID=125765 RepID=UPI003A997C09